MIFVRYRVNDELYKVGELKPELKVDRNHRFTRPKPKIEINVEDAENRARRADWETMRQTMRNPNFNNPWGT